MEHVSISDYSNRGPFSSTSNFMEDSGDGSDSTPIALLPSGIELSSVRIVRDYVQWFSPYLRVLPSGDTPWDSSGHRFDFVDRSCFFSRYAGCSSDATCSTTCSPVNAGALDMERTILGVSIFAIGDLVLSSMARDFKMVSVLQRHLQGDFLGTPHPRYYFSHNGTQLLGPVVVCCYVVWTSGVPRLCGGFGCHGSGGPRCFCFFHSNGRGRLFRIGGRVRRIQLVVFGRALLGGGRVHSGICWVNRANLIQFAGGCVCTVVATRGTTGWCWLCHVPQEACRLYRVRADYGRRQLGWHLAEW